MFLYSRSIILIKSLQSGFLCFIAGDVDPTKVAVTCQRILPTSLLPSARKYAAVFGTGIIVNTSLFNIIQILYRIGAKVWHVSATKWCQNMALWNASLFLHCITLKFSFKCLFDPL